MSSSNQAPPRKSKGRQKVNMVKMSNESNLQVTFSKRRAGLFKKASELCTLCGAEAAIVVFSPADKVFCFGHPNVQSITDRFEQRFPQTAGPTTNNNVIRSQLIIEAHRNSTIRELNLELTQAESLLRVEKRQAEELELLKKSGQMQGWFFGSFDGFNFGQLCVLKEAIMDFKKNLDVKVQNDMFTLANPLPDFINYPPPAGGNKANPRGFIGDSINISRVPNTFNNNTQMLLGSNDDFNPYNYHGTIGFSENNIGLFGGPKAINYDSIDDQSMTLRDHMINSNNISTDNLVPSDHHLQNIAGGIITGFGSSQGFNMAFDPRLF